MCSAWWKLGHQIKQPVIPSSQVKPIFEHPACFRCSVPIRRSVHRNPIWSKKYSLIQREWPSHSPAKEHAVPVNERSPAPRRQKTVSSIFQKSGEDQAYRDQTKPKPNQHRTLEKATAKEEMPIFGEVGQGFPFAQKIVDKQQKLFQAGWRNNKSKTRPALQETHPL